MKKFLLSIATTAMATSAFAGSLSLDSRLDYSSITFNDATTTPENSRVYFRVGRLDYVGKLSDETSFRVRWSFTKSQVPALRDGLPAGIEYASITQKFNDNFSISFGKMYTEVGGFEGATSGADLYLLSEAYSRRTAGVSAVQPANIGNVLGTSDMLYLTGAKAAYSVAGQTFYLMGMNAQADSCVTGTCTAANLLDQNYGVNGFAYRGAFMEKALQFVASYHIAQIGSDDKHSWYSAGVKWDATPITAQVDYVTAQHEAPTANYKLSSIIGKIAYTGIEQWIPRLEVTSSRSELAGTDVDYMGYGAVVEYVPVKENSFRYHVAYNTVKQTQSGAADIERQEVIVGTRLMADFLK